MEEFFDLGLPHAVEIIGYRDLSLHEADSFSLRLLRRIERDHFDHRLPGLGDDERFALGGLVDQARQVGLGFV